MESSKELEFSFKRKDFYFSLDSISDHYSMVLSNLLTLINQKDTKVNIIFNNLSCKDYKNGVLVDSSGQGIIELLSPYSSNLWVSGNINGDWLFDFIITGQNNCCGASTVTKTNIQANYHRKKIGTILQYLKEDIVRWKNVGLMTCTDIYYTNYRGNETDDFSKIDPYMPNTKLLLSTGWEVSNIFFNRNSINLVALYTKKVTISNFKSIISMKIKLEEDKLVKVEEVTIGADPELFLRSKDSGEYIPSFFVMQGDKYNPTPISDKGHNIQCDNVMVEYGIPPSKVVEEFIDNNMFVQEYIKDKVAKPNNLELVIFPFANFDENNLLDERAKHFG